MDLALDLAPCLIQALVLQDLTKIIVSSHNYQCTPSVEDLGNLVARIQSTGADIVKIATTANEITDVARIFQNNCAFPSTNYWTCYGY